MSRTAVRERRHAAPPAEVAACRHHWLIESPHGALSRGRCKRCGEERDFRNSANDYIWDDDSSSSGYGRWRPSPAAATVAVEDEEMTAATGSGEVAVAL